MASARSFLSLGSFASRLPWLPVLALSLGSLLACPLAQAQATSTNLKPATQQQLDVTKILLAQETAWNSGDLDGFLKGYKNSPSTIFIGGHVSHGFQEISDDYHHNYPDRNAMGALGFTEIEVQGINDTVAIMVGKYHVDRSKKAGGPADGIFSLVFEKTEAGWRIVLDHTT